MRRRTQALLAAADLLEDRCTGVLEVNRSDVENAAAKGAGQTELDRLRLTEQRVAQMAAALRTIAGLADPVGMVVDGSVRPNGLRVTRMRVPLGVVGVIYENRPNVTSDSAGLCLKAGNATMLRGSSSALGSNRAVVSCLRDALAKTGLPRRRGGARGADRPRVRRGLHATRRGSRLSRPPGRGIAHRIGA